ncbi:hypothetical protein [Allocoleopsis sp.]|uniref:hypothetical protein n=1 Tax=Allocoleopsis sp. TaxID=3088169 RepID=UPI002FD2981A
MIASASLVSHKQRITRKFLGFLQRTFKDLLDIGSELSTLKSELCRKEFGEYLNEEFRGSKYLAETAIALSSWFSQLSDRVQSHILKANSIQTLTNWSLAALRELPKVGEEVVRSLLKLGAVTVKKIREVAGTPTKTRKPAPATEVLETKLQESWQRLHNLEVELYEADSISRDSIKVAIEVANKDFAYCAGKLGISVGEALRRVKGDIAVVSQQEIDQRVEAAIAQKRAEVEEALTQTQTQAEQEVRAMHALKLKYAQENEQLKSQLQQIQEVLREKELYRIRVEELERELAKARQVEDVVKERIAPVLQQVAELKEERDRLLAQLAATQPEEPVKISPEEWKKLQARRVEADLTVEEFAKIALVPYSHTRGSDILESQVGEVWERLERHIEEKSDRGSTKRMTMSYGEAQRYGMKNYGEKSDREAQRLEAETLSVYHPEKAKLLAQMQKEVLKYGLKLRDLVAEPFSVCVCTGDLKRVLAKMSLSVLTNVLQAQQVIDGQLGRAMPISSFTELMQTLQKSQHEQLELF